MDTKDDEIEPPATAAAGAVTAVALFGLFWDREGRSTLPLGKNTASTTSIVTWVGGQPDTVNGDG